MVLAGATHCSHIALWLIAVQRLGWVKVYAPNRHYYELNRTSICMCITCISQLPPCRAATKYVMVFVYDRWLDLLSFLFVFQSHSPIN